MSKPSTPEKSETTNASSEESTKASANPTLKSPSPEKVSHPFCLPSARTPTEKSAEALMSLHLLPSKKRDSKRSPTKKRPYRRTKRPKNYCDKSTITTTTDSVSQQNAYDAVLAESADLWQAAAEAQSLGRLKMASAYMLLLHARLVGLGKRFDKARKQQQVRGQQQHHLQEDMSSSPQQEEPCPTSPQAASPPSTQATAKAATPVAAAAAAPSSPDARVTITNPFARAAVAATPVAVAPVAAKAAPQTPLTSATPKTQAARQLAQMLPSNIELDTAMMEHLAKAAAELHAARSGRKKVLQSPNAREFLAGTANTLNLTTAAACRSDEIIAAWNQGKSPQEIASLTGRTEQQVKAFVKNQQERERLAGEFGEPKGQQQQQQRGRKPATTAMNTVPNANCDARLLLRGGLLQENSNEATDE